MAPSPVWNYFKKIENGNNVKCNECNKNLAYKNSTSTLIKHLKTVHKIELPNSFSESKKRKISEQDSDSDTSSVSQPKKINLCGTSNELVPSTSSSSSGLDLNEKPIYQGPLNRCLNNVISFSEGGYRNNDVTNALMYMIAVDNLPLCTPEKPGFRMFVRKLQPLYKTPCEPTITKRMTAKYEELKIKVKAELQKADSICLTTDIWTHQHTMRSYLGLTVHYLKGYEMNSYELGAYYLRDRKTIAVLRVKLRDICNEWEIDDDKISAIVSDGGANIKGAIKEEFGESKHISCFGHVINNIGQKLIEVGTSEPASELSDDKIHHLFDDESDTEEFFCEDSQNSSVRNLIMKVKKIVKFFRCSEVASRELEILQEQAGCKSALKLIQEVRTRWNSCYEMVDRFINLAEHVNCALLKVHRDKSSRSKPPDILTGDELDALIEIRDILKPLWNVTHEVSADKEVTLSKCIPLITGLKRGTDKLCPVTLIGQQMKKNLVTEIKQKFSNIESVKLYSIATLLDPRYKKIAFQSILNSARAVTTVGMFPT
ncbi:GSCOCG00011302001-RA-CDS [Cotesia congregata]|nr:GSCOCG00011302001-RA-CDS [Cotesia congregata]